MADFWESKSPKQKTKFILALILLVLVLVFAIANWHSTNFDLIFVKVQLPLTLIVVGSMLLGYIIASFTEGRYQKRQKLAEKLKQEELTTRQNTENKPENVERNTEKTENLTD